MEAAASSSMRPPAAFSASPPSLIETQRLHQELGVWMANTRYQLQVSDQAPIWRVQNTSMVLSSSAGITSYYLLRKYTPKIKSPFDIIPPFIIFYLTYRAAQVTQMPGLCRSLLRLPTPLGECARGILGSLRAGGRLPSHEFGTQMPPPRQRQPPPGPPGAGDGSKYRSSSADGTGASMGSGLAVPQGSRSDSPGDLSMPPFGEPPAAEAPGAVDPWADSGPPATGGSSAGWGGGDAWDSEQRQAAPGPRRTWDEIRAKAAQEQQQGGQSQQPQWR